MNRSSRGETIQRRLTKAYPESRCSLEHRNPYELLVATILSAQCTDERVNAVTPGLFRVCPNPKSMAALSQEALENLIRPTGFYRNKAKSLLGACRMITEEYGGEVPRTMEELIRLPGVARKTGNVVLGNAFGINAGFVVDTHVRRLAGRLGLSEENDPEKVERDLVRIFPKKSWTALGHRLIDHGRATCSARKPSCGRCVLSDLCPKIGV